MHNCDVDLDDELDDQRSLSSMRMKKLISSMDCITINEDKVNSCNYPGF